jgi:hypothetical protein
MFQVQRARSIKQPGHGTKPANAWPGSQGATPTAEYQG